MSVGFPGDPYADFQAETLSNGLSVHAKEVDRPWSYVGFVCHVGAKEDPPGRAGMAHLVEHLVSENVEGFTFEALQKCLRLLGGEGSFGHTSYYASSYSFFLPDDKTGLGEGLSLFGQMLVTAQLSRRIEEEKLISIHEFHQEYASLQEQAWELVGRQALFAPHPRLSCFDTVLGTPNELKHSNQQELQAFYDRYYVPSNISVVSIGCFSLSQLVRVLEKSAFGSQKRGQCNPLPSPFFPTPPQRHELVITMSELTTMPFERAGCEFSWALPSSFPCYPVWIVRQMIEDQLTRILREEQGLTYDVDVQSEFYHDCRSLTIALEVPPDSVHAVQEIVWHVLGSIQEEEEQFCEIKRRYKNRWSRPDCSGADLLRVTMNDLALYHRLVSYSEMVQLVETIAFFDILAIVEYLTPERLFLSIKRP